jgi:hypothetical protein
MSQMRVTGSAHAPMANIGFEGDHVDRDHYPRSRDVRPNLWRLLPSPPPQGRPLKGNAMKTIYVTDDAIRAAADRGTLKVVISMTSPQVSIEDEHGLIEYADSVAAANERIRSVLAAFPD